MTRKRLTYLLLSTFSIVYLFPVFWVVISSFKDKNELYQWPPTVFPSNFTFENFRIAFGAGNFGLYFWNSLVVTFTSTLLLLLINSMAGFALAKYRFRGGTLLLILFI